MAKRFAAAALLATLAGWGSGGTAAADLPPQVSSILERSCYDCHDAESRKSGLSLVSMVDALRGGDSGEQAVVPGNSGASFLIELVSAEDSALRMPPRGDPLAPAEIAALRAWIDDRDAWEAAAAEAGEISTDHWALQPLARPALPASGEEHPVDAFLAAKLAEEGLAFNPPADPRTLARRMHLGVTGLLPSPEELEASARLGPEALAERLLASPHFGERWAVHWMDVVRFAESAGFETNHERPAAYHYRDWLIQAFNEDKPYDRFVFEQIAGDAVGEDAATGFLVGGPWDRVKGRDPLLNQMQRQDELADMVNTTGTAFLGLTLGCAKCHNHKFDPVTQRDYFALQAVFAGVEHGERELRGVDFPERQARAEEIAAELAELRAGLAALRPEPFHGRTLLVDDSDETRAEALAPKRGEGINPGGTGRGEKDDPGGTDRLPNLSGGSYSWWNPGPGEDVHAWRPGASGRFRVWLSWGSGHASHSADARYVLDRDGDPATAGDQIEIATVDQRRFADGSGEVSGRALWSGLRDAGIHEFSESSAILLRGGETGGAVTADVLVLQAEEASGEQPRLRPPVNAAGNEETFAPVLASRLRFTIEATSNGNNPCLDELEIWTAGPDPRNAALAGTPSSSGDYGPSPKHRLAHVNDGKHGNDRSWISSEPARGWIQIDLNQPARIERVAWARDREGQYQDRLPTRYRIEVSAGEGEPWITVAGSDTRAPHGSPAADAVAYDPAGLPPAEAEKARRLSRLADEQEQERVELLRAPLVYAGKFVQPGQPTRRLFRGDPLSPKEAVAPEGLSVLARRLGSFGLGLEAPEQERRVALARWIIHPDNPLAARVMVNRLWHYHFGQGIVATPSDFGAMGFLPAHPELLDWLAAELVDSGWSLKRVHRLILTSRAYRQSSAPRAEALAKDAGARWLWRFPPRRLEAEAIRDNILLVAGTLDRAMHGPGYLLFEPNSNYSRNWIPKQEFGPGDMRRMIYALKLRMEQDAVFGAFDCPDAGSATPARSRSTTPIQALNLYNSGFVLDQAGSFASRVRAEAGEDPEAQARTAFRLALGRDAAPEEAADAASLARAHGLEQLCRALFNANEFLYLQ